LLVKNLAKPRGGKVWGWLGEGKSREDLQFPGADP